MTGYRIREILFGNWRNKGVALFFAVTIWLVAYQSETQRDTLRVHVATTAREKEQVIIHLEAIDEQGRTVAFDGNVSLSVIGPRKQIENLRGDGTPNEVPFEIDAGPEPQSGPRTVELTGDIFPFIPKAVEVTSISPSAILVTFERAVEMNVEVEAIFPWRPEGMEVASTKIDPPKVKLRGPKSVLEEIKVIAEVWLSSGEHFEETVPLIKRYPDGLKDLVERTVSFVDSPQVKLTALLRYENESFDADNVRLRFLVPATEFPLRIQFDEELIKVKFQGPVSEINRLKERVRDPQFYLGVPVPLPKDAKGEKIVPFTEDDLCLYGFSDQVRILQHSRRQEEGKVGWSYTVIPISKPSK